MSEVTDTRRPDSGRGNWPARFAGLNGTLRGRICQKCGHKFATIEITEQDLFAIAEGRKQLAKTIR